jgi:flagellar biosynthesis protein FlhB
MAEASSEERTLPPTEWRRERARRAGDAAISRDLIAGFAFAGACAALVAGGKAWVGGLLAYLHLALAGATSANSVSPAIHAGLAAAGTALAMPLGVVLASSVLAGLVQTRGNFAAESLRAHARRFVPSLGRLFGRESGIDAAMDLGKIAVLGAVALGSLRPCIARLVALSGAGASQVLDTAGTCTRRLGIHLAIAMVALGLADYLWQRVRHQSRLRMTRDEARREHKESEGDPEHLAERRRIQRESQMEGALADVAGADLVLVDPGVAAVAISCSDAANRAPVLRVRGERLRAWQIEAGARAAGVPSFVEPALVRALVWVEAGGEIPEALHLSVARLLVRARGRRHPAGGPSLPIPSERGR